MHHRCIPSIMQELVHQVTLFLTLFVPYCLGECRFPDYIQTPGNLSFWSITYNNEKKVDISFKSHEMLMRECRVTNSQQTDSCQEVRRFCIKDYGQGRFLFKQYLKREYFRSTDTLIRCIQFVKRSDSVVQIKMSRILQNGENEYLCQDELMMMDNYPMISNDYASTSSTCAISGGYDFQLYTHENSQPVCDNIFLPLRVESDCKRHEGMRFYFRRRNCISKFARIYDSVVDLRCIALWQQDEYTFSVVKWHGSADFWCVRVTFKKDKIDEMYIFLSGHCPVGRSTDDNILIMRHFKMHFVQGICEDQSMICKYEKENCANDSQFKDNCKMTCSLCEPEHEERPCQISQLFTGKWNSLNNPTVSALTIQNSTLKFTTENIEWQCVETDNTRGHRKRVFKLKFYNGCYPRYRCIDMELPALSVMRYRPGSELSWPLDGEGLQSVCEESNFDYNPPNVMNMGISRTPGPWLYYIHDRPKQVPCNLPWYIPKVSAFIIYDANFVQTKQGCLINTVGIPGYVIKMYYTYYDESNRMRKHMERDFICVASIKYIGEHDMLITWNTREGNYICWTFIQSNDFSYVLLFEARDCGKGTNMQLVHYNERVALANLVIGRNSSECEQIERGDVTPAKTTKKTNTTLSNLTEQVSVSVVVDANISLLLILQLFILLKYR